MSDSGGTLEALLGQVAILMSPLTDLSPQRAPLVLAEIGLPANQDQAATIASALAQTTAAITGLIDIGTTLEKAIADSDWTKVISQGLKAIDDIGKLISGFDHLGTAIASLNLAHVTAATIAAIPDRLMSWLLVTYFQRSPGVNELLQLTGLLTRTDHNVGSHDPDQPFYTTNAFDFGQIGGWLSKPGNQLATLYDWGKPTFGPKLLALVDELVGLLGLPTLYDPLAAKPVLDLVFAQLAVHSASGTKPPGLEVRLRDGLGKGSFQVGATNFTLAFTLDSEIPAGSALVLRPGDVALQLPDATVLAGKVRIDLTYKRPNAPLTLLSMAGGSAVQVGSVTSFVEIDGTTNGASLDLGASLANGTATISTENLDGFLGTILGGLHLENQFSLGIAYSTAEGLHFEGSSALDIQLASHIDLGPVELTALSLSLGINGSSFPIGITTDLSASLGPLYAEVDGIGVSAVFKLASGNSGNLGPIDLSVAFQPPNGVGLQIDAGVVTGGGYLFFDPDKGEYAGALELNIADLVDAKAIALINTILPDGSKGFSLLIIISAEFSPAFQLGYGFTLLGVGGLLGLNRSVVLKTLRDGVKTNSISSIMFPTDVVKNAKKIISDLRAIFPPANGVFLIGPMAKIGWGTPTLVSLSFGLIIEIPGAVAILGVLKIALPTDDLALIQLQINFIGTLDFDAQLLAFDASLYDSHILFITLEGDMAVRLKWGGQDAGFLVSVGGFHPSYTPPAGLQVPPMNRLAIIILDTDWANIRVEAYFAVTSNTVQLGARAELYFGFSAFNISGYIGFDALLQFSPFHFEIEISAGLSIHVFGLDLLSIQLDFMLSGPTPWRIKGRGSIQILFFSIDASFDFSWGDSTATTLLPVKVLPLWLAQLSNPANWQALPPPSHKLYVTLAAITAPDGTLVLHPAGSLVVRQKVAPLDYTLQKLGTQKPSDVDRATITTTGTAFSLKTVDDEFAISQFTDLSDAQKLSVPDYQAMHAGVKVSFTADLVTGKAVRRKVQYDVTVIDYQPAPRFKLLQIRGLFGRQLAGNAIARAPSSRLNQRNLNPFVDTVDPPIERYVVAATQDNRVWAGSAFTSSAMAEAARASLVAAQPGLADQVHVIPEFEVNAA